MWNKKFQFSKGFTLIEMIVAIFVLTVGILGAFTVVQDIIVSSQINASRLTATYLAQEGIELVRNKRDSNWLAGNHWHSGLPSGTETGILNKFNRTITTTFEAEDKIRVEVEVSWQERGRTHSVSAQTELFKWY